MSQHNSKSSSSRKSKFSSSSSSNPPASSHQDYPPSYKPQAPPSQAPHYSSKPNYSQNSNVPNYSDSHSYPKPSYDRAPQPEQMSLPNYNSMNYMAFYPPGQMGVQSNQPMAPPPRGNNPMEMQQPQYASYYNLNQGYLFGPGYQSAYIDPNFPQQDLNGTGGMMGTAQGNKGGEGYMQVENAEQRERMEVMENYGNNESNVYQKRQRKEETKTSEFDVMYKKTHTENVYRQRLETLANELAKIKETEIEIIQALINSPHPNVTTLKARKELESLLMQKNVLMQTQMLTPNLVIQTAIATLPYENMKNTFAGLLPVKLREVGELEQMKKEVLAEARKLEEEMKKNGSMEQEKEEMCKVIHVSSQQYYQSEPALKELEDKLDKMEHNVREKRGKVREATKKVGETQMGLEIAKAKCEIATRRLQEMGLSSKGEKMAQES